MGWYQALYEGNGRGEGPSGPRPKGLGLLGHILRWHWWTLVKANVLFCLFCLPLVTIPLFHLRAGGHRLFPLLADRLLRRLAGAGKARVPSGGLG